MEDIERLVESGWKLHSSEKVLLEYFKELYSQYPDNARISYEYGGVLDFLGREEEAVPLYLEAIELGISGPHRIMTLIQLGSSYRNIGRFENSISTLETAVKESGNDPAALIFLSLAYWSGGSKKKSLLLSLRKIFENGGGLVERYRRSIDQYLNTLEEPQDEQDE